MCQNVPPLELFDHFLYKFLRSTWREAITAVVVRLHHAGDGQLADEWLLQGLLNKKYRPLFVDRMIEYGWLVRVDGKLCRAGLLAPSILEEQHLPVDADRQRSTHAEQQANTRALQLNARIGRLEKLIEKSLGLAVGAQTSRESLTNEAQGAHKPDASAEQMWLDVQLEPAQTAGTNQEASRAIGSDSESDPILLLSKGKSDSDSDPRSICAAHNMEIAFDALVNEGIDPNLAVEAIAKTCNKLKAEKRPAHAVIRYARRVAQGLKAERDAKAKAGQQDFPMPVAVKGGAAQSTPGRSKRPAPLTPEQQAAADEALKNMLAATKPKIGPIQATGT
jgi:hypothetical protein